MTNPEITRIVTIEHAGKKLALEVHIHLSQADIEHLATHVEQVIARRLRASSPYPVSLMQIEHRGRVTPEIKIGEDD